MRDSRDLRLRELARSRFPQTFSVIEAAISGGGIPGAVVGVWDFRRPEEFFAAAWGDRRKFPTSLQSLPMTVETSFDISSVSKIFATASLAALLVQRGWLSFETPVRAILPAFGSSEIRIRHLLSHTA